MNLRPKQLGKYELQERLGQGGMAEVWKAFDPQLKRYVAIKFLHTNLRSDPDFVNRFVREGQAIASLHHPNIVQVYDFQMSSEDSEGSMAYMIMDYIEGRTLADYIRETSNVGVFPSHIDIVRLFTAICQAVDYAHEHHMIHRDIKPANILLDSRNKQRNPMGEPVLTDFGIVKMLGSATLTATGMSLGTPLYISPEQVKGLPGNEQSDIYSLAVMLYEICAGVPAFQGDTPYGIMIQRLHTLPAPVSQINPQMPVALDEVIYRSLAIEPQERYATASLLAAALAQALQVPTFDQVSLVPPVYDPADQPTSLVHNTPSNPGFAPNRPSNPGFAPNRPSNPGFAPDRPSNPGFAPNTPSNPGFAPDRPSNPGFAPNRPSNPGLTPANLANPGITLNNPVNPGFASNNPSNPGIDSFATLPSSDEVATVRSLLPTDARYATSTPPPVDHHIVLESHIVPQFANAAGSRKKALPRNILLIALVAVVLLALIGSGTYFLVQSRNSSTGNGGSATTPGMVGTASFFSTGQLTSQGMPGINDGVVVHIQNVPPAPTGEKYYAWLRDDRTETLSVNLGVLNVQQGVGTLSYTDSQHQNLLATMSNFLVTTESASVPPGTPSLDPTHHIYMASLPNKPSPKDSFSYLDHLRHLLTRDPDLSNLGLNGGVDFWFLSNIQEMQKQTMEVKDHTNVPVVRQQITNILYYLDGKCAAQELSRAPVVLGPENAGIAHDTSVSLLDCPQVTVTSAYLTHIALHLNGLAQAPGASPIEVKRAIQIDNDLTNIKSWLLQVHKDALQLAMMDDTHLAQAQQLRGDLAEYADFVVGGRVDPTTQAFEPSAQQICDNIELLADFEIVPSKSA